MKSLVPVVAVLVVFLVIAVQEVELVSSWGRRFGRSLDKKYSNGRTNRRQMQFYRRNTVPAAKDEDAGGQSLNEHLPVRWGVTILTEYSFLRAEIFCYKGYQPFAWKCLYALEIVNGYDTGALSGQHTKNCRGWGCNKQPDVLRGCNTLEYFTLL